MKVLRLDEKEYSIILDALEVKIVKLKNELADKLNFFSPDEVKRKLRRIDELSNFLTYLRG